MGFVIWHYLGRIGVLLLFPLTACAMIAQKESLLYTVGLLAFFSLLLLGAAGAILALRLLFTRFRFSCPQCKRDGTEFGSSKKEGMWLYCSDCDVVVRESGFLGLRLSIDSAGDSPQPPA